MAKVRRDGVIFREGMQKRSTHLWVERSVDMVMVLELKFIRSLKFGVKGNVNLVMVSLFDKAQSWWLT